MSADTRKFDWTLKMKRKDSNNWDCIIVLFVESKGEAISIFLWLSPSDGNQKTKKMMV